MALLFQSLKVKIITKVLLYFFTTDSAYNNIITNRGCDPPTLWKLNWL